MYSEDDLLPLSALQHLVFCERQCALIHIEGQWVENTLTVEGRHLHDKTDAGGYETRSGVRLSHGLLLRCLRLGLTGKADVVEFHSDQDNGVTLPGTEGFWIPFPVEYKRGRPKQDNCDKVQLCAQALCLEEMLNAKIPKGALFYGTTRRRLEVTLDESLRRETESVAARLHELVRAGVTPKACREPKCERCSLIDRCCPDALATGKSAKAYLEWAIKSPSASGPCP
jgi:CRISPR-associated exonuclease Cas4